MRIDQQTNAKFKSFRNILPLRYEYGNLKTGLLTFSNSCVILYILNAYYDDYNGMEITQIFFSRLSEAEIYNSQEPNHTYTYV